MLLSDEDLQREYLQSILVVQHVQFDAPWRRRVFRMCHKPDWPSLEELNPASPAMRRTRGHTLQPRLLFLE